MANLVCVQKDGASLNFYLGRLVRVTYGTGLRNLFDKFKRPLPWHVGLFKYTGKEKHGKYFCEKCPCSKKVMSVLRRGEFGKSQIKFFSLKFKREKHPKGNLLA